MNRANSNSTLYMTLSKVGDLYNGRPQGNLCLFGGSNLNYVPDYIKSIEHIVLNIIKLEIFPVPVRLHSGYGKLIFVIVSPFLQYLRTLYIASHHGFKLCTSFLNISKHYKTVAVRLRLNFQLLKFSTVHVPKKFQFELTWNKTVI